MTQSTTKPNLELVTIKGKEVMVLVPEIEGDLALVHFSVLQRLAAMLPLASLKTISSAFRSKLYEIETTENATIQDYVSALEDELSFHKSVNLINITTKEDIDKAKAAHGKLTEAISEKPVETSKVEDNFTEEQLFKKYSEYPTSTGAISFIKEADYNVMLRYKEFLSSKLGVLPNSVMTAFDDRIVS